MLKYEASFNTAILALVRTRAADRPEGLLIVRFADDRQRERAGTPQVCSHALRRTTRWRLPEAEETTEEPHCFSPAGTLPLAARLEFRGGTSPPIGGHYSLLLGDRQGSPRKAKIVR